jgi:hypothetical protein
MSDDELRRMRGIGGGSLAYLRETLGAGVDRPVDVRSGRVARRPWLQADDELLRSLITTGKHAGAPAENFVEKSHDRAEGEGVMTQPVIASPPWTMAQERSGYLVFTGLP